MEQAVRNEIELRIIRENTPRIRQCLKQLGEQQIHYRPNAQCNSVANLVVHLNGNVRQWILNGVLGVPFERDRPREFHKNRSDTHHDLLSLLSTLEADLHRHLPGLSQADLEKMVDIQSFHLSGFSACIHAIEHFSYHTGQIALITKWLLNEDLGFYRGMGIGDD